MDFQSLMRRDLQFLCKRNKIPANMTNLAMADALKALEIVEGLDDYTNQSPTSLAKQPPNSATRTTRRKTTVKAQSSSKSFAGEMDQENINKNVAQELKTNNVAKTPAARKASVATSCSSKVQESKKSELVQSVYSTRRSTRLLEKCMGDLSLKTKEILDDKPEKTEETEQDENPAGSEEKSKEAEVIPSRDLNVTMEKEWEMLKNDSDQVDGNVEIYAHLGDITANTEINLEKVNEVMSDEKESEKSIVQVENQEEVTWQPDEAMCEEGSKKNDNDQEIGNIEVYVGLGDIPVMEHANTESNNVKKESENVPAFESSVQVDQHETEQVIQENDSKAAKFNTFDEEAMIGDSETEPEDDSTISEAEKINTFEEEIISGGDSDTEPEEDNCVDSDSTISEADSNQAVLGSEEEMILSESEGSDAPPPLLVEEAKVKTTPFAAESISVQLPRPTTPLKNSALKLVNVDNENKENNMEMMMNIVNNENGESKVEAKKKKVAEIDEEKLKDLSMRQLEKMLKQFSIKTTNNRPALQILPGNNQIAE